MTFCHLPIFFQNQFECQRGPDLNLFDMVINKQKVNTCLKVIFTLTTSAFEELGLEFINFACNCVINTLRLIVYLTGFSI